MTVTTMSGSRSGWTGWARALRGHLAAGARPGGRGLRKITGPDDLAALWALSDARAHAAHRTGTPGVPARTDPAWPDTLAVSTLTWMAFLGG